MQTGQKLKAFTVMELLIVIVVLVSLAIFLLPDLFFPRGGCRANGPRINCVNNLRQVGLAFLLWAGDNNEMYPMRFFTNQNGMQLFADATNGFRYFQIMSNELSTPKILVCPAELKRTPATNFTTDFNRSHIGYFIGLDASEASPQTFLSGDWNVTNGLQPIHGILNLQSNQNVHWTEDLHKGQGNVGLADGSVQQLSSAKLKDAADHTGLATNRLLLP